MGQGTGPGLPGRRPRPSGGWTATGSTCAGGGPPPGPPRQPRRCAGGERPDVARPAVDVVTHRAHHADPREPLDGELEPDGVLRPCRAPVVPRGPGCDRAQLADLGLQRRGARHRHDLGGQPDHLGHPTALLSRREVAQHPPADRAGGAHVQSHPLCVLEHVDPWTVGQAIGQAALAPPGLGHSAAVPLQLGEGVHPEVADPLHQPVQNVNRGPRVGQGAVVRSDPGPEVPGQRAELAVGHLVTGQDVSC